MPLTQVSSGGLADDSVSAAKIATGAVTVADIPDGEVTGAKIEDDVALGGNPTTTTQTAGNNTTRIATTAFVTTAVGNISQDSMTEGDTKAEVVDTGSDGHFLVETEGTERLRVIADGKVGIGTSTPSVELEVSGTGAIEIPQGTTAQRPSGTNAERAGLIRYNTETNMPEFFNEVSNSWATVGVQGGLVKTADPTIPDEIIEESTVSVTNPTVVGGSGTITFTYQWMVELSGTYTNIPSGTSQSVTLPAQVSSTDVLGNNVRCTVTATDDDGFNLVINSNETTVTEFIPNLNAAPGVPVVWNVNSGSGTTPSSFGWAVLPNSEKGLSISTSRVSNNAWYIVSDAGNIYTISYTSTGAQTPTLQTGNMYTWSGNTITSISHSSASKITQVNSDGEMRYTNDSGSNWDDYNTSTTGFSKVLFITQGGQNHPLSIHEDGEVKHATSSGAGQIYEWDANATITSYSLGDTYCSPPTGKKICYIASVTGGVAGRYGAVVLCNDKRLYAIGNTGISGWPENGTRSAPVLVTGLTQTFNQIGNFGNSALPGLQAIDTNGNIWFFDARTDNNPFEKRFTSTTFMTLFGQQFPYTDNCCSYNLQDMMAIGENNVLHSISSGAASTSLNNTWDTFGSLPTWDSSKARHGGDYQYNNNYSGDWSAIILPQ